MSSQHADTIASEVLSASLGGAVSASILYPLEVLKTRMQADDDGDADSDDGNTDADEGKDGRKKEEKPKMGMIEYATNLYNKEGFGVYLNGIETSAFQSAMEKSFYFFAYTALKQVHQFARVLVSSSPQQASKPMGAMSNLFLGCLAEWAHLPITMPIDCLTTAIQTSKKQNAVALMLNILKDGNMYNGIQAYYVLCFKPALQYTVYEQVKAMILQSRNTNTLSAGEAFVLGMIARTVATVAVFPFVRAKVVMQSRKKKQEPVVSQPQDGSMIEELTGVQDSDDDDVQPQESQQRQQQGGQNQQQSSSNELTVWNLLSDIYTADGISGLYQGIGPELTRGIFSAALMLMIKEKINGTVKNTLYGHGNKKNNRHHR